MMMSMAIQDVYGRYMMFKDWPRGAALWWRRIPTATSGRAVRESDRMLLGSAHAVPTHVGWRRWQSAPRRLANSASQTMHLNPNACTTAGPDARSGMNCWLLAICALKTIWSENCDWKCPSVHTAICNILMNRMCIEHIFRSHKMQSRSSHPAAFRDSCNWKIENKLIKPTSGDFIVH